MNGQGNIPVNNGMNNQVNPVPTQPNMGNVTLGAAVNNVPVENVTLGAAVNNNNVPVGAMPMVGGAQPMTPPQPVNPAPVEPMPMPSAPTPVVAPTPEVPGTPVQPAVPQPEVPQQQVPPTPPANNAGGMDDSFVEPKKKPVGLIVVILLLLLVAGGAAFYYFVLDNPRTIFTTAVNKVFSKADTTAVDGGMDYTLSFNVASESETMKDLPYFTAINNLKLEGIVGKKNGVVVLSGGINYKDEKLLDYGVQVDSANKVMYIKADELYDKVLKMDINADDVSVDISEEDYRTLAKSIKKAFNSTLETAEYDKEIVKLNGKTVKKVTLYMNESFVTNLYNRLLQDNDFLESYAKVTGSTADDVKTQLNSEISNAAGNNEKVSLYLSLLGNSLSKVEYVGGEDSLSIEQDGNTYNFATRDKSGTTTYEGYVKLSEVSHKNILVFNIKDAATRTSVTVNATYTANNNLPTIDATNAVNYEDLTDDEITSITTKLMENSAFTELMSDISGSGNELVTDMDSDI